MLTSTSTLAAVDATQILASIKSAEITGDAFDTYLWEVKPTPAILAEMEQDRVAMQFETDARRALTRVANRIGDDFEAVYPTTWAYLSTTPRATVPNAAKISTEAFIQNGAVDPRLDPSQWLPWLDIDRDGYVTGDEYNTWGATFHPVYIQNIVPHPYDPTDAGPVEDLGLSDKLVPLAFYTIEQTLENANDTEAAPNAVFAPTIGTELPVLNKLPGSVSQHVAFFQNSYYFANGNTYSNALGLFDGQPSGILGSVVYGFSSLYPIDFGTFELNGSIMDTDATGLHAWNPATKTWNLVIARMAEYHNRTEDNGGFVAGNRVFVFNEQPDGDNEALGLDYYDLGDGQFHSIPGLVPNLMLSTSPDNLVTNVVVIGTIAYVQLDLDPQIHAFDTVAMTWSVLPPGIFDEVLTVLGARDGQLLRIGGGRLVQVNGAPYVQPTYAVQAYDPSTNTWSLAGTVPRRVDSRSAKSYVIDGAYVIAARLDTQDDAAVASMPGFAYTIQN